MILVSQNALFFSNFMDTILKKSIPYIPKF